jgi:hypothetical protein
MHTHTRARTCLYTHAHERAQMRAHKYANAHTRTHVHTHVHTHAHVLLKANTSAPRRLQHTRNTNYTNTYAQAHL